VCFLLPMLPSIVLTNQVPSRNAFIVAGAELHDIVRADPPRAVRHLVGNPPFPQARPARQTSTEKRDPVARDPVPKNGTCSPMFGIELATASPPPPPQRTDDMPELPQNSAVPAKRRTCSRTRCRWPASCLVQWARTDMGAARRHCGDILAPTKTT
jgi:hypothetical protein